MKNSIKKMEREIFRPYGKKILIMIAAVMLTACSNEDEAIELPTEGLPMMVEVSETPMTDADTGQPVNAPTRGDVITIDNLSSFGMNYTESYHYDFSKTGETWNTKTWPGSVAHETAIDFYAYTAGTFNWNSGSPYVSFSVEGTPTSQYDLLVAKTTTSYNSCNGIIPLSFKHACAAVLFNVQITNTLHTNKGDITVNSIELKNVNSSGQYHYADNSWKSICTSANYTLTNSAITVSTSSQQLPCGHLFMIPQTLGENAKLVITYTFSGRTPTTAEISLNGKTWEAGKRYTYNIRLGTNLIK